LICDGSAVSRTTYPSLFAAIGIKYGPGDGSTTFNLPNLKGRTPVGKDTAQTEFAALAQNGGEKTHLLTAAEMPAHSHKLKSTPVFFTVRRQVPQRMV
jgi:microcystin-dependent protein